MSECFSRRRDALTETSTIESQSEEALRQEHRRLKKEIKNLENRGADSTEITPLKRKKLRIKEKLVALGGETSRKR